MPAAERARVLALWHLVGPAITLGAGRLPWRRLGLGEDLPLGVYRQWKRWCRHPGYAFEDATDGAALAASFARVRAPVAAAAATDDRWSPPRSRDAVVAAFRNARVARVDLDPVALGTGPLGHMGYFRARARPLWESALAWLDAHGR